MARLVEFRPAKLGLENEDARLVFINGQLVSMLAVLPDGSVRVRYSNVPPWQENAEWPDLESARLAFKSLAEFLASGGTTTQIYDQLFRR